MIAGLLPSLVSVVPGIVSIFVDVAWKAALLIAAAGAVHFLAGRNRVLLRSAVWHVSLVGLLLLPVAVTFFPRIPLSMGIMERRTVPETAASGAGSRETIADLDSLSAPISDSDEALIPALPPSPADRASPAASVNGAAAMHPGDFAGAGLLALYVVGLAALLVRLATSLAAVGRLRRAGTPVSNPAWLSALDEWCTRLDLTPTVQLRQADAVGVPVVVGGRQPTILIPLGLSSTTDREAIDAVLLHELTHVIRCDYAWNLLLRIVEALYWPHPCVWLVGRAVRQVREEVCDSVCLHWLRDTRAYCGILVEVASGLRGRSEMALGMTMTRSSKLSRRLKRLERSAGSPRGFLGRPARRTITLIVVAAAGLLGMLRPGPRVVTAGDPGTTRQPQRKQPANVRTPDSDPPETPVNSTAAAAGQSPGDPGDPDDPPDPDAKSRPLRLRTVKVQRGTLPRTVVAAASLVAFDPVSIHTRTSGVVSKVAVAEGDRVKKGEVLLVIDIPDLEAERAKSDAALAQAEVVALQAMASNEAAEASVVAAEAAIQESEADVQRSAAALSLAKKQHDRMHKLFEQKAIDEVLLDEQKEKLSAAEADNAATAAKVKTSKANLTRTKAGVRLAEADVQAAKLRVAAAKADLKRSQARESFREIRAPIDGVVLARQVETDMFLKPDDGRSLLTLAQTNVLTAIAPVAENDAALVKRGAAATVTVPALGGASPFSGKVSRVPYAIDPATHTVSAFITIANRDEILKPGMFAQARIVVGEIPDALFLPASAIIQWADTPYMKMKAACVRVVDGRAAIVPVKAGYSNGEQIEIREGLTAGSEVLDGVHYGNPADGDPVEVIPATRK